MVLESAAAAFVGKAVIEALIGKGAVGAFDKSGERVVEMVARRLREAGPEANHDLQRAVRRSELRATLVACHACLGEEGVSPSPWRRRPRGRKSRSAAVRDLDGIRSRIEDELDASRDSAYVPPESAAGEMPDRLLETPATRGSEERRALRDALVAGACEELAAAIPPAPPRLVQMIEHGWEANDGRLEWFELMCGFFVHELKTDTAVQRIFSDTLLKDTSVAVADLADTWRAWSSGASERLERFEAAFEELASTSDTLRDLGQQLDVIAPALLALGDIAEQLRELRRRPRWESYAGDEIADRVEQTVDEHTGGHFAGRDDMLAALERFRSEQPSGVLVVRAPAGFGKSALLAHWVRSLERSGVFVAYHFFRQSDEITRSIPNALRNLVRQLGIYFESPDETIPTDYATLRDHLRGLVLEEERPDGNEPLVIVIDALDEADGIFDSPFHPPLPASPLPANTYIVVSARADAEEPRQYLTRWSAGAEPLHLSGLARTAIAEWVSALTPRLQGLSVDDPLTWQIENRTGGFPLFLRYLSGEIRNARSDAELRAVVERTPTGFDEYVQQQWQLVAEAVGDHREAERLFGLLVVALGPLTATEIQALTDISTMRLVGLPWQVTRWFSIRPDGGDTHYSFAHPLLGGAFEPLLGNDARKVRRDLLDYCRRWPEDEHPYALRHLADHLAAEAKAGDHGAAEELYELARNEALTAAQLRVLPDDAGLPLRTIHNAIEVAASRDDGASLAELVLLHVGRLDELKLARSPLRVLRDRGLEPALLAADRLFDVEMASLWYLLLAVELQRVSRGEDAALVLERLAARDDLTPLANSHVVPATVLMTAVAPLAPACLRRLVARLLPSPQTRGLLVGLLVRLATGVAEAPDRGAVLSWLLAPSLTIAGERGGWPPPDPELLRLAGEVAEDVADASLRAGMLLQVAQAQVPSAPAEARQTLAATRAALEAAERDEKLLGTAVRIHLLAGADDDAAALAAEIDASTLLRHAGGLAGAGAVALLAPVPHTLERPGSRAAAFVTLARIQARSGLHGEAADSLRAGAAEIRRVPDGVLRMYLAAAISLEQARLGFEEDAGSTLEDLPRRLPFVGMRFPGAAAALAGFLAAATSSSDADDLAHRERSHGRVTWRLISEALAAADPEERERALTAAAESLDALDDPAASACAALTLISVGKDLTAAIDAEAVVEAAVRAGERTEPAGRRVLAIALLAYHLRADRAALAATLRARLHRTLEETAPQDGLATAAAALAFLEACAGEVETARAHLARAHASIGAVTDAVSRSQGWALIAEAHDSLDEPEAAVAATEAVEDDGDRAALVVTLASLRVEAGDLDGARTLLDRASADPLAYLSLVLGETQDELAGAYEKRGEDEAAAALRAEAQNLRDLYIAHVGEAVQLAAESAAEDDRPGLACAALVGAPVRTWAPKTLLDLLPALAAGADPGVVLPAVGWFAANEERHFVATIAEWAQRSGAAVDDASLARASGLRRLDGEVAVAIGRARGGDPDPALDLAGSIAGPDATFWRLSIVAELALGRLAAGDAALAVATIENALAGGSAVETGRPNDWTLSSLADAAAIAGDFDTARAVAATIADEGFRRVVEEDIATASAGAPLAPETMLNSDLADSDDLAEAAIEQHLAAGEHDLAAAVAAWIRDPGRRARALEALGHEGADQPAAALPGAPASHATHTDVGTLIYLARYHARSGHGREALGFAAILLRGRSTELSFLATQFLLHGDRESFKEVIVPLAYDWEMAYDVCEIIARLFPEAAGPTGRAVAARAGTARYGG